MLLILSRNRSLKVRRSRDWYERACERKRGATCSVMARRIQVFLEEGYLDQEEWSIRGRNHFEDQERSYRNGWCKVETRNVSRRTRSLSTEEWRMGVIATRFSICPSCSTVARIRICATNYHRWWSSRRRMNLLCAPKSINSCVDRLSGSDSCDYSVEFVTSLNQCSRPYDLAWVKMHPDLDFYVPISRLGRTRSDDYTYRGNTFWPVARSQLWVDPFLDFWWFFIKIWGR